ARLPQLFDVQAMIEPDRELLRRKDDGTRPAIVRQSTGRAIVQGDGRVSRKGSEAMDGGWRSLGASTRDRREPACNHGQGTPHTEQPSAEPSLHGNTDRFRLTRKRN